MKTIASILFIAFLALPVWARSSIEGVGLAIGMENNTVIVHQVFVGSPAESGGVHENDLITAVDGHDITGKSLKHVVKMIRGPAGTRVSLTLSDGHEHFREAYMIREKFEVPQIEGQN